MLISKDLLSKKVLKHSRRVGQQKGYRCLPLAKPVSSRQACLVSGIFTHCWIEPPAPGESACFSSKELRSCQEHSCGLATSLVSSGSGSHSQQIPFGPIPWVCFCSSTAGWSGDAFWAHRGPDKPLPAGAGTTHLSLFFRVLTSRLRPSLASVASSSSR